MVRGIQRDAPSQGPQNALATRVPSRAISLTIFVQLDGGNYTTPSKDEIESLSGQQFVAQLGILNLQPRRIQNAILDFYRATTQRSRWAADELLFVEELEGYEDRLTDEWDRMRMHLEDEHGGSAEAEMQRLGKAILGWMELEADIPIRKNVTESYVLRGSYHGLANMTPPRVWWHPEFRKRLEGIVEEGDAS